MAINDPNQQQNQGAQPNQPRQLGTGFTNLQNIMQANTGNKLGQAVGGGIQQAGQQTTNALQSGVQDFNTQSQANALGTQAQKQDVQNTLNNVGNLDANQQQTADTNFAKYRSGQYGGPTNISNISNIQNQAANAQQQGQEVGSSGGRQALLQQYAAKPGSSYGSGAQNLDNLLLGATGGQQLQQARQSVSGLNNQVNAAQTTAQSQAQQLQNQAKGFGQQVTGQVSGAQSAIYNPAQQQAQQANVTEQQGLTAEQAAAQNAQAGNFSADTIKNLGLSAGERTYGVNLGQYIGYNPANEQATALNVMGQPQFKQYTGLQQLMGQTPSAAPQQAYQAGNATYDQAAAQNAISQAGAPLQQQYAAMLQAQQNLAAATLMHANNGNAFTQGFMNQAYNANQAAGQQYNLLNNSLGGNVNQI